MCDALSLYGHDVAHHGTVESAYRALVDGACYDIVILDLLVGDSRGERLVTRMKARKLAVPAIILASAEPLATLRQAGRVVGACRQLQKPFSLALLIDTISAL